MSHSITSTQQNDCQKEGGRTPAKGPTPEIVWVVNDILIDRAAEHKSQPVARLTYRLKELAVALGVAERTIDRERAAGRFPKPDLMIGLGKRKTPLWMRDTIVRWLAEGGSR